MIRHHVAQRAGLIVVAAALLDPHRFGGGYLNMIDIARVPDRLENAIAEAESHQILHSLLTEIMIDAINLALLERLLDLGVERVRRIEIAAERLLDDDPAPAPIFLFGQAGIAELLDGDREESRRDGEVE